MTSKHTHRPGSRIISIFVAAMSSILMAGLLMAPSANAEGGLDFDYRNAGTKQGMQSALQALDGLSDSRFKNFSQAGYEREEQFGTWKKPKEEWGWDKELLGELGKSCNTRKAILIIDSDKLEVSPDFNSDCKIKGQWTDHYGVKKDGKEQPPFVTDNQSKMQIDHIVSLGDAYRSGALKWDNERRYSVANDPLNLESSAGSANGSKSDKGPAKYLPYRGFKCEYAERYTKVKEKYELSYTREDADALKKTLSECVA